MYYYYYKRLQGIFPVKEFEEDQFVSPRTELLFHSAHNFKHTLYLLKVLFISFLMRKYYPEHL